MGLQLSSRHINTSWEPILYQMDDGEHDAAMELFKFYGPFSPVKRMSTYFGVGGALPLFSGHVHSFDLDYVVRKMTGLSGFDGQLTTSLYAGGKGYSLFNMFASSLSEWMERGLGMLEWFSRTDRVVYGTYRELSAQGYLCVNPDDVRLFAPEQFASPEFLYQPFTEDAHLGWIEGKRLISGRPAWVPAQLVALYYPRLRKDEAVIGYSTSGGQASHINEKEAIFHGVTEIFERDAINIHWYCKIPPAIIDIDRPPHLSELRRLLGAARGLPATPRFYLHRLDVPEMLVLTVIEYHDWFTRYKYYAGGGVEVDIDACMLSAMNECGQAMVMLGITMASPEWDLSKGTDRMFGLGRDEDFTKANNFIKILSYYGYKKNFPRMQWYVETPRRVPLSSLPSRSFHSIDEKFDFLLGVLDRQGLDPIIFDFTPPQFDHLRVMKTVIFELSPPFLPAVPMLGNRRYYELPQKLGFADGPLRFADLNRDPMPYP